MEPWRALDVDDSDLPSLLRPCKRRNRQTTTTASGNHQPIATQSGESPDPDPQPNFSLLSPSQTLHTSPPPSQQSQQYPLPRSDPEPPCTTSASSRSIPGPAGLVQTAMLRKAHDRRHPPCGGDGGDNQIIPTQEYIRRAVEEGEYEDDFNRNPWLCALEFLGQQGGLEGGNPITPLSSIKKNLNIGRVDLVVAVIKSCKPNGRGDLMVTLKVRVQSDADRQDPTGTIGASVHRKVLEEVEIRKDVSVGSVLILQKVAVFFPSRSVCYINITNSNVVKVISKDSAVPLKQDYPVAALTPALSKECSRETGNARKGLSLELERPRGLIDVTRQRTNVTGTAHNNNQTDKENRLPSSSQCSSTRRQEQTHMVEENASLLSQNAAQDILKKAMRTDANSTSEPVNESQKGGHTPSGLLLGNSATKLLGTQSDQGPQVTNGVGTQRQPLTQKSSVPEWTDEQLTELLALACEDDGSFF